MNVSFVSFKDDLQRINDLFKNSSCIFNQRRLGSVLLERIFDIIEKARLSNPDIVELGLQTLQDCAKPCPFLLKRGLSRFELLIGIFKHYQQTQPNISKLCCSVILTLCVNDQICHVVEKMLLEENLLEALISISLENQFELTYFFWKKSGLTCCPNRFSKLFLGTQTLVDFSTSRWSFPVDDFVQLATSKHPPKMRTSWQYVRSLIQQDEQSTKTGLDFLNLKLLVNPIIRVNLRFFPDWMRSDSDIAIQSMFKYKEKLFDPTKLLLNHFIDGLNLHPDHEDDLDVELDFTDSSFFTKTSTRIESLEVSVDPDSKLSESNAKIIFEMLSMENPCIDFLEINVPALSSNFVSLLAAAIEKSYLIELDLLLDVFEFDFGSCLIQALREVFRTLRLLRLCYGASRSKVDSLLDILCSSDCNLAELIVIYNGQNPNEMVPFIVSILRSNRKLLSLIIESEYHLDENSMVLISAAVRDSSILIFDLSKCQFKSTSIAKCIETGSSVVSLYLSGVTDDGLIALANAISSQNGNLSRLKLFPDEDKSIKAGVMAILNALKSPNNKLIWLDLPKCGDFGDFGANMLSEAIQDPNCQLMSIDISYWGISSRGFESIAKACQSQTSKLRRLTFGEIRTDYYRNAMVELGKAVLYGKVYAYNVSSYGKPMIQKVLGFFETWILACSVLPYIDDMEQRMNLKNHIALTLVGHRILPNEIIRAIIRAIPRKS